MTETSQLFAYDIRCAPASFVASHWSKASREMFLLRPEIKYPLSATERVWPSIFNVRQGSSCSSPQGIVIEEEEDRSIDPLEQWKDLDEMVQAQGRRGSAGCGIAMGLVPRRLCTSPPRSMINEWLYKLVYGPCRPSSPAPDWQRLGYDVAADTLVISAISDCERTSPEEREEERARWAGCLNEFGLFEAMSDAGAFCVHANRRIPEHGPFLVFELFLVWGMEQLR